MKTSPITREDLIKACNRLGYPLSARKLTDWVQKGLLPPLQQRGRGRGLGKEYFWPDREVVAQAVVVSSYLAWTNRTDDTLLLTWFAGFPVSLDRVRPLWSRMQSRGISTLNKKFRDAFDLEDWIRRSVRRELKKSSQQEVPLTLATNVYLALLANDFDPLDSLTASEERHMRNEVEQLLDRYHNSGTASSPTVEMVKRGLQFIHDNFSPTKRKRVIESATDQDLLEAQRDWRVITHFMSVTLRYVIIATANHRQSSLFGVRQLARWRSLWWRMVGNLGASIILLDVALRQAGYREALTASIMVLLDANQKVRWAAELSWMRRNQEISPRLLQTARPLIEQLSRIWQPFFD